ncbi:MAG: phospholipase, partial [Actinobacteria bacterium]|nr:phospholipase [Actinomycetota bacterium]
MSNEDRWLLRAEERGNRFTTIDRSRPDGAGWTAGNRVEPLIHGATYFARLLERLQALHEGDRVLITDWRGDDDELLAPDGPTLGGMLCDLARRGVEIRGLLWRSHPKLFGFNQEEDRELVRVVNAAGGDLRLDERVRRGGSHHQKLVVLLHRDRPEADVAFVGGIDLCHGRRDDERHDGDPQAERLDP